MSEHFLCPVVFCPRDLRLIIRRCVKLISVVLRGWMDGWIVDAMSRRDLKLSQKPRGQVSLIAHDLEKHPSLLAPRNTKSGVCHCGPLISNYYTVSHQPNNNQFPAAQLTDRPAGSAKYDRYIMLPPPRIRRRATCKTSRLTFEATDDHCTAKCYYLIKNGV